MRKPCLSSPVGNDCPERLAGRGGGCNLAAAINEELERQPRTVQPPAVEEGKPREQKPQKPDKKPEKPVKEVEYRNRHWETKHPGIRGEDANHKDVLEHANDHQNRGNKGHKHHND